MKKFKSFITEGVRDELDSLAKSLAFATRDGDTDKVNELRPVYDKLLKEWRKTLADYRKEKDLEILSKCIKKDDLEDGAWYSSDFDGYKVARFSGDAQWVEDRQMFLAPGQQQFGTDGWLDYFDPDSGYAGFPPMQKVNI